MIEIKEYIDPHGNSSFRAWFDGLDVQAALKVNTYLTRMGHGNFSAVQPVGNGVYQCRIHWGPGYRVYFGKEGERLVILLGGGSKRRQQADIKRAQALWA